MAEVTHATSETDATGKKADMQSILVIDDDKLMCMALARILVSAGYTVTQAFDGDEGLQLYRTHGFDLVITDLIMPDKEGIQIIRDIFYARFRCCHFFHNRNILLPNDQLITHPNCG